MTKPTYPGPESIHRTQLDNGVTVLVYENFAAESVEVEGVLRAGALADPQEKLGLASFTAGTLMRGTTNRSFEQIYDELESAGASLSFSAGRHTAAFGGSGLSEDLDLLLSLIADAMRNPIFPVEHVERVRGEIMTGLHMAANDTRRTASKTFSKLLYGNHPYAYPISGELETIAAISRDDLVAYHQRFYGPSDMIFTIVGAVKVDEALQKIKNIVGDWKRPGQEKMPAVPPAHRPTKTSNTHTEMPGKTQADIVLGLPGPLRSAPDYQDIRVANTILGVFGMYGRLGKTVREAQGLAYYVFSQLSGGLGPSPWLVGTGVAPNKVEQAISTVRDEIKRIQDEEMPASELADTQAFLTGSLPVSLETNSGMASVITDMELYQLGLDYLQQYPDNVNAVTTEQVQAAAQKYMSADEIAISVAGP